MTITELSKMSGEELLTLTFLHPQNEGYSTEVLRRLLELERVKEENERVRKALKLAIQNCGCTAFERDSGHLMECYVPELEKDLASDRNEQRREG